MKEQKGITLIALVITIIVLLILAGVSIAMLSGENGLLTQSQRAAAETKVAEAKDRATSEVTAAYTSFLEAKYSQEAGKDELKSFKAWLAVSDNYLKDGEGYKIGEDHITITLNDKSIDKAGDAQIVTGNIQDTGDIKWVTSPAGE